MKATSQNEIYEKLREKVFFSVSIQKRTEAEIRRSFLPLFKKYNIPRETYNDLVEELKQKGYIDDEAFVKRKFIAYTNFKLLSIKEIEYKILQKGVSKELIKDYIEKNKEELKEHELNVAKKLYEKKNAEKSDEEFKQYLKRKGYIEEVIEQF